MSQRLVGLMLDAFDDLDRVVAGLDDAAMTAQRDGSSFAWTCAHLGNQLDAWINHRLGGAQPDDLLGDERFRIGGPGRADDWPAIRRALERARTKAEGFVSAATPDDFERRIPYDGSFEHLRRTGMTLAHALLRVSAHHYFHIGEIATKRDALGHSVGDYPSALERTV